MTIEDIQNQIIEEFDMFEDWMEKYEYLIEQGKALKSFSEEKKIDKYLIKGCQSKVWLNAFKQEDKVIFEADSDAIITRGMIALLLRAFSEQKPKDILESNFDFLNEIGLKEQLSPTRSNGLNAMIKQIRMYAIAFSKGSL